MLPLAIYALCAGCSPLPHFILEAAGNCVKACCYCIFFLFLLILFYILSVPSMLLKFASETEILVLVGWRTRPWISARVFWTFCRSPCKDKSWIWTWGATIYIFQFILCKLLSALFHLVSGCHLMPQFQVLQSEPRQNGGLPSKLRQFLCQEVESRILEALKEKELEKMPLSDIFFICALLSNLMYCSYSMRLVIFLVMVQKYFLPSFSQCNLGYYL